MQSGKSFFNAAIYKKTLLRSWPVWLVYIGAWVAQLPMGMINQLERGRALMVESHVLNSATQAGAYFSFVACAVVAMVVFGWMYNTRQVSFTASLPVSRSAHYGTALAVGFTILLGGNAAVFVITAVTESLYGGLDMAALWQWLGWVCLLVVGLVHTGIAYTLYFNSMKDLKAQTVAIFSYIDPAVAIVLSSFLPDETPDIYGII